MTLSTSTTLSNAINAIPGVLLAVVLLSLGLVASAQAAAPAWTLQMSHTPSTLERIPDPAMAEYPVIYKVSVENSGDEATTGTYTLSDTPPSQLTVKSVSAAQGWSCTSTGEVLGGTPLSCHSEVALAPGASVPALSVVMNMSPSAPDSLANDATISGGGAGQASATDPTPVIDRAPFGPLGFVARSLDEAGNDFTLAGGHPYEASGSFSFPVSSLASLPVEPVKDIFTELPPGFVGNVSAFPRCPLGELANFFVHCPAGSVIGVAYLGLVGNPPLSTPLYNMVPEKGHPAEFAFKLFNNAVVAYPVLRPRTGKYGVTVAVPGAAQLNITSAGLTLYGVPSLHNGAGGPQVPLLSNPVDCQEASPSTRIIVDSWTHPGRQFPGTDFGAPDLSDPFWKTAVAPAPAVTGCDDPALASQFKPTIDVKPVQSTPALQADQPAGLDVNLAFPQANDPTDPEYITNPGRFDPTIPQTPALKNATVTLPAGMSISPSAADGLAGCSDQAEDPSGDQVHYDTTNPVSCPDASKIGTVTATTPLLAAHDPVSGAVTGAEPVNGDVYVLKPHPGDLTPGGAQDGTFRLLIQLESQKNGINVKLPGTVKADKSTGQLMATFLENPQLPVKHIELNLKPGPRAPLATPNTCGNFTTGTDLVPWSTPGTPDATPSSSFGITSGPNGAPCVNTPQERPFSPAFVAGNETTAAGAYSSFMLHLTRGDGEQDLKSIDVTTPKGFVAKLAGIPYCPDAAIAAAAGRSGAEEQANPSCPAASQVGTLTTGAGPGTNPYYVSGKAYLAGPYAGGSLSLVFITPAVAGPFDLGNVVVRAGVYINPETAQVTVRTGAIPQLLDGIPLQIRRIDAKIDRVGFVQNPTDCTPKSITGTITGGAAGEASENVSSVFQAAGCAKLKFAPKFSASIGGHASKRNGESLTTKVVYPNGGEGSANITRVKVELPKQLPSRLTTLQQACTAAQFAKDPAGCPAGSVVGHAVVHTPVLPVPLTGPAIFVSHGGEAFPSLTMVLQGDDITVDMVGTTFIAKNGVTSTTFKTVPDVPFTSFELTLPTGKFSALGANLPRGRDNYNFCGRELTMPTELIAQNGAAIHQKTKIAITGCPKPKTAKKTKARNAKKRHSQTHRITRRQTH